MPVNDEGTENPQTIQFHYHLELTPAQLKITWMALHSYLDDFGHDEHDVIRATREVLDKLPDEQSIKAIDISRGQ